MPRHEPKNCGCRGNPIEIEKDALRPFLFGKDVGRWLVDWKRAWVMFPYDVYAKKKSLYDDNVIEGWSLIPTRQNLDKFGFATPDAIETIEERFPRAWRYLRNHEDELRTREHGRYARENGEEYAWYGATYPRALDYYFRPKLVLQVLSRRPAIALDEEGKFVFTAGGTAGVYGITFSNCSTQSLRSAAAVLNSKVSDFQVKQISSVFGSRFYSYGDQFIEQIVLPMPSEELSRYGYDLVGLTSRKHRLRVKQTTFPESFTPELSAYELDSIKHLCNKQPNAENLKIDYNEIRVQSALYGFEVLFGNQSAFEFEHSEHAECVAEALRNHHRQNISRKEILSWRLPVSASGCSHLLALLQQGQAELSAVEGKIASQESQLNDLVFTMYGLDKGERKVIDDFLGRYSGGPAAATDDAEDTEADTE